VGTAKITATSQANPSKKASIDVTVQPKISVSISPSGTFNLQNKPKQFSATVSNSANQAVTWSSSNTGIATVNGSGLVSAVNTGSATITATAQADPRRSASVTINVLAPVKILLLGDSITQGLDSNIIGTHLFGYRRYLYTKLNSAGYRFDFVGSINKVFSSAATCIPTASYPIPDVEHEGHAGWRTNDILNGYTPGPASICTGSGKLSDWLQGYSADIVVIHLGTNDINTSADRLRTAALAATDTGSIIDTIRARFPNIKILLSKIIANNPGDATTDERITDLNGRLTTLASSKNTTNSPITLVDQYTHFKATFSGSSSSYLMSDGIHPNATGENAMAQKYFDALVNILAAP
jgi:lysophospholipase L1-like esterase